MWVELGRTVHASLENNQDPGEGPYPSSTDSTAHILAVLRHKPCISSTSSHLLCHPPLFVQRRAMISLRLIWAAPFTQCIVQMSGFAHDSAWGRCVKGMGPSNHDCCTSIVFALPDILLRSWLALSSFHLGPNTPVGALLLYPSSKGPPVAVAPRSVVGTTAVSPHLSA